MASLPSAPDRLAAADPASDPPASVPAVPAVRAVLVAGGLAALGLLLVDVRPVLGPYWAAAAGAVVLWPMRREPAGRAVLLAGGVVMAAYLLARLGGVLAPFIGVFLVAYLLNPIVVRVQRRFRVERWVPAVGVTLLVVGVLVAAVVLLVPAVATQVEALAASAVRLAQTLPSTVAGSRVLARLEAAGVVDRAALVGQLSAVVPAQAQALAERIPALFALVTRQVGALVGLVTTLALLPVLLFYTLKDFPRLRDGLVALLPRYRGRRAYVDRVDDVFGSYVRGQLTISAVSAVLVAVPLTLFGVPFSLLLGLAAGVLNLIPSIGAVLTYVLGVVTMLAFGTTTDLLIVLGVLAVQALIEQAVLTPNIMGQQVNLHPVTILLALFVFGALFGLLGLILAVPAAALVAGAVRAHREALVLEVSASTPTAEAAAEAIAEVPVGPTDPAA